VLIRAPESWPQWVVAVSAMLILAVLDLAGALAAKESVERRSYSLAVFGVVLFVLLFWVYASSLQYAELAPVTFGWIVILQVGVVLVDRFRYDVHLSGGKVAAVLVMLLAQAYLLVSPSSGPARAEESRRPPAPPASSPTVPVPLPTTGPVAGEATGSGRTRPSYAVPRQGMSGPGRQDALSTPAQGTIRPSSSGKPTASVGPRQRSFPSRPGDRPAQDHRTIPVQRVR
jgi:hypothetical protein